MRCRKRATAFTILGLAFFAGLVEGAYCRSTQLLVPSEPPSTPDIVMRVVLSSTRRTLQGRGETTLRQGFLCSVGLDASLPTPLHPPSPPFLAMTPVDAPADASPSMRMRSLPRSFTSSFPGSHVGKKTWGSRGGTYRTHHRGINRASPVSRQRYPRTNFILS